MPPTSQLQNLIRLQIPRIASGLTPSTHVQTMQLKPIHLLWPLANGPVYAHAFPFVQNQRREMTSVSTSSIDLAHIVTPVTLSTSHSKPSTGASDAPDGTLDSESQQRSTPTPTTLVSVSPTPQSSSDISSASQSTVSASTTMKPSLITPHPSLSPTSRSSSEPTMGGGVNVHMLTLNVPAIIMEHTVTTTVFVIQAPAEAWTLPIASSGINRNQDRHRQ